LTDAPWPQITQRERNLAQDKGMRTPSVSVSVAGRLTVNPHIQNVHMQNYKQN